jgi:hypothetical protein
MDPAPARKRRFEGYIHQKIDPSLQTAISLLAKAWNCSEPEVPVRAIRNAAMQEGMAESIKQSKRVGRATVRKQRDAERAAEQKAESLQTEVERLHEKEARAREKVQEVLSMLAADRTSTRRL